MRDGYVGGVSGLGLVKGSEGLEVEGGAMIGR